MSEYSIRRRLIIAVVAGSALVLLVAYAFLDLMIGFQMQKTFDELLLEKALALESLVEEEPSGIEFEFSDEVMPQYSDGKSVAYFQIRSNRGATLRRSVSLGQGNLPQFQTLLDQFTYHDIKLPDGRPGRLVELVFIPRYDEDDDTAETEHYSADGSERQLYIILTVATERLSLQQQRLTIRMIIAGAMMSILIAIAVLVRKFISSGLQPLEHLATQVKEIDARSLKGRVSHTGRQSLELAPIEKQVNKLLDRLESAFMREKRFSADVAHELRTPLAELKTLAEIGKVQPLDSDTVSNFFRDVEDISVEMEHLVTTLLELARADSGQLQVYPEEISLAALVDSAWLRATHGTDSVKHIENEVPADLSVYTDFRMLELILLNLLSNAARYSPQHAIIRVFSRITDSVELTIANPVTDLETADLPMMHERFWQKERSHSDSGRSGLGLSLVMALALLLQIKVHLRLDDDGVLRVILSGLQPCH